MTGASLLQAFCERGVRQGVFPGAAFAAGTADSEVSGFAGRHTYDPASPAVGPDTIWDLASVSKAVATTSIAMILVSEGALALDAPVAQYVPAFGKSEITVRNLLRHDSGLIPHRRYDELGPDPADAWRHVLSEERVYPTGTEAQYSCVGFLALFQVLTSAMGCGGPPEDPERGEAFAAFFDRRIATPLGMTEACFNPSCPGRCAPTEVVNGRAIQGVVHDENARFLGGVSGNAGLFGPLRDVVRFARALLRNGDGVIPDRLLEEWTRRQEGKSTRGLGWDTKSEEGSSAGSRFGPRSYGHLGFTGTSLWIDPDAGLYAVLLTNRVHPTRDNLRHHVFRPRFHDLAHSVVASHRV
jgi:CubicO group peptidase (beta-lactamase class C family)